MSNMKYEGELHIITKEDPNDKDKSIEKLVFPIDSFEVDGGANRKIVLKSADDVSVTSEFEQARSHKNLVFYIPPMKDFQAAKLIALRAGGLQFFEMNFTLNIYSGGKKIQSLWIGTENAWLLKTPTPEGSTPPVLRADIRFGNVDLLHGKYDPKRKKIVHKAI